MAGRERQSLGGCLAPREYPNDYSRGESFIAARQTVTGGRSSVRPGRSRWSSSTSPMRPPAVKRLILRSGTSSCTAGMAPSIRPCCDLSEHWSRSLLGPKEPGRVSAARRASWEGSQENRSRQATRRDPESRNDRRQLRSRRVRFQSRRWTGLRLPSRCTRSAA
jgi:hypothetical protein